MKCRIEVNLDLVNYSDKDLTNIKKKVERAIINDIKVSDNKSISFMKTRVREVR